MRRVPTAIALVLLTSFAAVPGAASARPPAIASGPAVRDAASARVSASSAAQLLLDRTLAADLRLAGGADSALVVDLRSGQTLFSAAPNAGRLPASVEKLWTTSTALLQFGPTARLQTTVLGAGSLAPDGTWTGKLYLRGGGDPTFGTSSFDSYWYGPGVGATVQQLAHGLRAAGIEAIDGAIVGDESYFDSLRGTPATGYAADGVDIGELSALALDNGYTTISQTALQPQPALFAAQQFAAALRQAGVRVPASTRIATGQAPAYNQQLAAVSSPTIATLIRMTNAPSDNFFAEMLLKDIGASFGGAGSTAAGAAVVRSLIAGAFHLHPRLNDGSGLSRYDRSSAAQIVSLLGQMQQNRIFARSLAVAGVSGTLQQAMRGTRAAGNCRGKTGTLHDVANLAGYCTARNGDRLAFAFLFNAQASSYYGHQIGYRMAEALANYNGLRAPYAPPTAG